MRQWVDVLPLYVAIHQTGWERRHAIMRAHESGASLATLAEHMGIGPKRVRELLNRVEYERSMGKAPPIEVYLNTKDQPPRLTKAQRAKLRAYETQTILW